MQITQMNFFKIFAELSKTNLREHFVELLTLSYKYYLGFLAADELSSEVLE